MDAALPLPEFIFCWMPAASILPHSEVYENEVDRERERHSAGSYPSVTDTTQCARARRTVVVRFFPIVHERVVQIRSNTRQARQVDRPPAQTVATSSVETA